MKQVIASTFTLVNTILGIALLSLSFTFCRVGMVMALILIVAGTVFSLRGFIAIATVTHHTQLFTLREMLQYMFGRGLAYFLDFCIAFNYVGYLVAYVSVIGDYMHQFIKNVSGGYEFQVVYIKLIAVPVLFLLSAFGSLRIIS